VTVDPLTAWLDTAQADADPITDVTISVTPYVSDTALDEVAVWADEWAARHSLGDAMVCSARTSLNKGYREISAEHALMVAVIRDVLRLCEEGATRRPFAHVHPADVIDALSARLLGHDTPNETKEAGRG
jgi:hypothetical protein